MPERVWADGCRITITEWDVRVLDAHGDAQEVEPFETRGGALAAARAAVAGGAVAAVVEKHVQRAPAHLFDEPSRYTLVAAFGDRDAIRAWGGEAAEPDGAGEGPTPRGAAEHKESAMKKEQIQVGKVYAAKVSGSVVPVRIKEEQWRGDKHVGWVGTNVRTGKTVRIKSAQRLRNEVGPTPPEDGQAPAPAKDAPATPGAAQAGPSANGAKTGGKAKAAPKTEGKPAKAAKEPKTAKPAKPKRVSAIDAAAQVLAAAGKPMKAQEMIDAMEAQGLWRSPGGKTPAATLYAAVIREIAARKKDARFRKTDRGTFEATAHASAGKGE